MIFLNILYFSSVLLAMSSAVPLNNGNQQLIIEQDPEEIGGFFEGDMDMDIPITRNGLVSELRRWPDAEIFYKFDAAFDSEQQLIIEDAMQAIEAVTCVRFYPATEDMTDYVEITTTATGCHSNVGYLGRIQNLNLDVSRPKCLKKGVIIHELLHTVGFRHQHCASDRDEYVLIVEDNIIDGNEIYFQKYSDQVLTQFGVEYDYDSILHYAPKAFSKNGLDTIVPIKDPNAVLGQRIGLSVKDIEKVNLMYNCRKQTFGNFLSSLFDNFLNSVK